MPKPPPNTLCGVCRQNVNCKSSIVFCNFGCNSWYHRKCIELFVSASSLQQDNPCAKWACRSCLKGNNSLPSDQKAPTSWLLRETKLPLSGAVEQKIVYRPWQGKKEASEHVFLGFTSAEYYL